LTSDSSGLEHDPMTRGLQDNLMDEDSPKTAKSGSESTKDPDITNLESKTFAPAGIAVHSLFNDFFDEFCFSTTILHAICMFIS